MADSTFTLTFTQNEVDQLRNTLRASIRDQRKGLKQFWSETDPTAMALLDGIALLQSAFDKLNETVR